MSNAPRTSSTTFRYSMEVYNYINDVPGKSFADKFEFVCLNYKESKDSREISIKKLDKNIYEKEIELKNISNKILKLNHVLKDLENLSVSLKECNTIV